MTTETKPPLTTARLPVSEIAAEHLVTLDLLRVLWEQLLQLHDGDEMLVQAHLRNCIQYVLWLEYMRRRRRDENDGR